MEYDDTPLSENELALAAHDPMLDIDDLTYLVRRAHREGLEPDPALEAEIESTRRQLERFWGADDDRDA